MDKFLIEKWPILSISMEPNTDSSTLFIIPSSYYLGIRFLYLNVAKFCRNC